MDQIENENLAVESEDQADALLESIDRPDHTPIEDAQPQTQDEWELTVGGKAIKAKRDQIMQWAQQGYSAPGKISQLSKEIETWKSKWSETEPKYKQLEEKYGPIDQYVREKPEFWDHVVQSFEKRSQLLADDSNPLASMVSDLRTQLQDLIQFKNQVTEERQKSQMQQEDQEYLSTFQSIKSQYADIDFDTPDDEGKSLEYRVLEHAAKEGIKNFKTAFRDYYHDELVKRSESKAKESLVKDKQKNTKLGILGITPTPKRQSEVDTRKMSYDQIAEQIKAEISASNRS